MSDQLCLKVYLENGDQSEIRKFTVNKSLVTSYNDFAQQLQSLFPVLQGRTFIINWRDEDGDSIVVSSDKELVLAVAEMNSYNYKFYVKRTEDANKFQASAEDESDPLISVEIGLPPYGCICDNCDVVIREFRYKCMQCDNYDLCAKCEAQGIHPMHYMIRMPPNADWRYKIHHVMQKFLEKVEKHCHKHGHKSYRSRRSSRKLGKGEPMMKFCGMNLRDLPSQIEAQAKCEIHPFMNFVNEMLGKPVSESTTNQKSQEPPKQDTNATTNEESNESPKSEQPMSPKTRDTENEKAEVAEEWTLIGESEPVTGDDRTKSETKNKDDSGMGKGESANVTKPESSPAETVPSAPVMDKDNAEQNKSEPPQTPEPRNGKLYPNLDNANKIFHSDPKIQAALRTLAEMGFTDRAGLLMYMLNAENGNIEKVLDILLR